MNYIIIGNSAAGINAVEAIRKNDRQSKITLISDENYPPYSRCLISLVLAGTLAEDKLEIRPRDFYKQNNIEAMLDRKVEKVIPAAKKIRLTDGKELSYDKLLIATGGSPKMMDIPGIDKQGVFGFRTIEDTKRILERLHKVKTAAILGGGLIGLKAAYGLHARGIKVKVIVKSPRVLSQMLDAGAARIFQKRIQEKGIEIITGVAATEVLGDKEVTGLVLDNGSHIDCQLVIVGKGVRSNIELVKGTEVKTHWGILVDEHQMTNIPEIYAAGDAAETKDITSGEATVNALWPCAAEQGRIAGSNMAGEKLKYDGSMSMNSVEFFNLPVISIGITRCKDQGYEEDIREDEKNNIYKKVVIKDKRIVGMILAGKIDNAGVIASLIKARVDISAVRPLILEDNFSFAKILPLIQKEKDKFNRKENQEITLTYK